MNNKSRVLFFLFLLVFSVSKTQTRYKWSDNGNIYLNPSFAKVMGLENLMPFGFKIGKETQMELSQDDGQLVGRLVQLTDTSDSLTLRVEYFFQDSTMYKFRIFPMKDTAFKESPDMERGLEGYFGPADYSNSREQVYSNLEYLVTFNYLGNYMEVISLVHLPLKVEVIRGVRLRDYNQIAKFWYGLAPSEAVGLEFYNQIAVDNNVQMALRLYYKGNGLTSLKRVSILLENEKTITFNVVSFKDGEKEKLLKVTRCFMDIAQAEEIMESHVVKVTLRGEGTRSFEMPLYQKYSLKSAIKFYKENVTNPFVMERNH